jgi:hypothetical protein
MNAGSGMWVGQARPSSPVISAEELGWDFSTEQMIVQGKSQDKKGAD